MAFLSNMKESLDSGDPTIRSWALVDSYWTPFLCCSLYVVFVKRLGPALMRNRRPFDLRHLMIVYNFSIVVAYAIALTLLLYYVMTTDAYSKVCAPGIVLGRNHYTYKCSSAAWYIYILKYVELADTVFFILRKKFHLITNLHVIHHTTLPIICWVLLRTETTGFQLIPAGINAFVHVIMYLYYGMAAMGPEVRKKLWWKEHLTLLQMAQFIIILIFMFIIVPLSGCKTSQHGIYIDVFFATLFLALFYNYYKKTYKQKKAVTANGVSPATASNGATSANGAHKRNGVCHKDS